ncbi:allantoate permease [Xylaria venustula]|nr:allantoate permease [Xylaria venustula]
MEKTAHYSPEAAEDVKDSNYRTSDQLTADSQDLDENYEFFRADSQIDATESEIKKVVRKIDWHVVPLLFLVYFLQYLDKNALNFANAYGLQKGTHLQGQDFSWLGSIFYFGYLVGQIPSGYLMQRFPVGRVVSTTVLIWGAIVLTTPGCKSFAGIATNRFFLGFTEATVNPAFVLIMSIWYKNDEQPLRLEAYYCTNGLATMFGGLIGYAVGHITTGLPKWMYVFLIFGAISFAIGIVCLFVLPDVPATARFLTPRERTIATGRVAANRTGVKNQHFKKYQAIQCAKDPKTWILFVMAIGAQIPNAAITSFTSTIIASFGFDTLGTQYLQIPGGAVQFLSLILGGVICSKWPRGSRCPTMITANTICIVGSALLVRLPDSNKWGRLVALWLCFFQGLGFSMSLTMISSNIAGSTKKQLTSTILFVGYCIGNIIGPQTFLQSEAPGYRSAYIAMLVGYTAKLLCIVALYIYMWRENARRDAAGAINEKAAVEAGMLDQTELDNKGFRYSL